MSSFYEVYMPIEYWTELYYQYGVARIVDESGCHFTSSYCIIKDYAVSIGGWFIVVVSRVMSLVLQNSM